MQHADKLVEWMESYKPDELFDENGTLKSEIAAIAPKGQSRMAMNPIVNGGIDPKPLKLPDYKNYALKFDRPGEKTAQDMIELGEYLEAVIKENPTNFRLFGPMKLCLIVCMVPLKPVLVNGWNQFTNLMMKMKHLLVVSSIHNFQNTKLKDLTKVILDRSSRYVCQL